jgi:general secretion pathway protein G
MGPNRLNSVSVCFSSRQPLKNIAPFRASKQQLSPGGFTLVELVISLAIIVTLVAIAVPLIKDYIYKGKVDQAIIEIRLLEKEIIFFKTERARYPGWPPDRLETLQEIGRDNFPDPWGTPYQYRNLESSVKEPGNKPKDCRKDRSTNPLNYDFDLYSVGPDRVLPSEKQLLIGSGQDDIVRAANGRYVGEGSKF